MPTCGLTHVSMGGGGGGGGAGGEGIALGSSHQAIVLLSPLPSR
eukprot:COSAG02_NODE_51058_length_316_cov_1.184332_1_plen_43_part_10